METFQPYRVKWHRIIIVLAVVFAIGAFSGKPALIIGWALAITAMILSFGVIANQLAPIVQPSAHTFVTISLWIALWTCFGLVADFGTGWLMGLLIGAFTFYAVSLSRLDEDDESLSFHQRAMIYMVKDAMYGNERRR